MENLPKNEELGKDYRCLDELIAYRAYIPASIELHNLDNKFEYQCRGCKLRKVLGFCIVKDELEEIRSKAAEVQKHTKFIETPTHDCQLSGYSTNPVSDMANPMKIGRQRSFVSVWGRHIN